MLNFRGKRTIPDAMGWGERVPPDNAMVNAKVSKASSVWYKIPLLHLVQFFTDSFETID